jgi:hypothetical protein
MTTANENEYLVGTFSLLLLVLLVVTGWGMIALA